MSNDAYRIEWKAGWIHYRSLLFSAAGIRAKGEVKKEEKSRLCGGKRRGGSSRDGWEGRGREREKERNTLVVAKFLHGLWTGWLSPVSRLCWMPCHPVISPYQPRNCLETSTALPDDAQLLSSFRSSNYSIAADRELDGSRSHRALFPF